MLTPAAVTKRVDWMGTPLPFRSIPSLPLPPIVLPRMLKPVMPALETPTMKAPSAAKIHSERSAGNQLFT